MECDYGRIAQQRQRPKSALFIWGEACARITITYCSLSKKSEMTGMEKVGGRLWTVQ